MYILAFKDGHDPAACLLKDGEIIAAAEEERFIRKKHAPSVFPKAAIDFCLRQAGISQKEVDWVAYGRLKPGATFWRVAVYYLTHPPLSRIKFRYFLAHMKVQVLGVAKQILGKANYQKLWEFFPELPRRIYTFDHHLLHAASAYYYSGFSESLILTMDGKGEATSVMLAEGAGNKIVIRERRGIFESLGLFYSGVTKYLGFTPNDGEYKVMGLAPYGKAAVDFERILRPDEARGYLIDPDYVLYPLSVKNFVKRFGRPARGRQEALREEHRDFAASAQEALEKAALALLRYALRKYPHKNLCLAGGVAYNVKMNKVLRESGLVEKIFVQPAAGDAGLVLGAAALFFARLTGKGVQQLRHLYLGPGFSDEEIKSQLEEAGLKYKISEPAAAAAELLAKGKVVGWFQDRMEFGPRALGNRSVLANPTIAEMKEMVNEKIKFREPFRPFCPSILAEFAPSYFANYTEAPFMIMSFAAASEEVSAKIPAVVHVDETVRPQAVDKSLNPLYHKLLTEFYAQTGVPAVLNTSMNVRGEPIVCTPRDAINFFLQTNVDALVIGNYLLQKDKQDPGVLRPVSEIVTEY